MDSGAFQSALEIDLDRRIARAQVAAELFGTRPELPRVGRFELVRRLGRGAMGTVYEARDPELGGLVALKLLHSVDAKSVYRLKREFRSLAGTVHTNLVSLGELFSEQGAWFFSMELIGDGVPFDVWVRPEQSRCDVARLRAAFSQLVTVVAALHAAGKLHCDLKPHNVLVTAEGRVVVLDFGLVSEVGADQHAAAWHTGPAGTPAYLAPEQAAGGAPSEASDWYAIGVMLFEALSGRLPFAGNPLAVLKAKQAQAAPRAQLDPEGAVCVEDLCALCDGLLARDAALRPRAAEVWSALHCDALQESTAVGAPASPSTTSLFVGREHELAAMRAALAEARAGAALTLLLGGPSGVGKSALLDRFVSELGSDVLVLRGRCHEQESVPYKVFDSVVDALAEHLRRLSRERVLPIVPRHVHALLQLFPALGRVQAMTASRASQATAQDAPELRRRAFAALKELLLRLTDGTPVVIVVDDLQWGDVDSARVMHHVLGAPEPAPLLFLGGFRSEEVEASGFLQAVLGGGSSSAGSALSVLELGPLPCAAAVELTRELLAREGVCEREEMASTLAMEAQGVPFFIGELVRHVKALPQQSAREPRRPVSLEQAIVERVSAMPAGAQDLLRVLSVAGGQIECAFALSAAGLARDDRSALHMLRNALMARSRGARPHDTVEVYHDRIREIVAQQLDSQSKRSIHARIAATMAAAGVVDPERLVAHYVGAGDRVRAGESAVAAAVAASEKLAFNRAAELYRRAVELLAPSDCARLGLHEQLGQALSNAGRGAQAAEAYLIAAQERSGADARRLERIAVQQYLRSGHTDQASVLADQTFRSVGLRFPHTKLQGYLQYAISTAGWSGFAPRARDVARATLARERMQTLELTFREVAMVDPIRGAALQAQFLRAATQAQDPEGVLHALAWQALRAALTRQNPGAALDLLRRVDTLAQRYPTPYAIATAKCAHAGCALFLRRMGEVIRPAEEAERIFREQCAGTQWEQHVAAAYRYTAIEQAGGFKTVLSEAPVRAREALDRDDRFGGAVLTLFITFTHLAHDQPEDSLRFLDEQEGRFADSYGIFHVWSAIRRTHALLYRGDAQEARRRLGIEYQRFSASSLARTLFYRVTMQSLLARCEVAEPSPRGIQLAERVGRTLLRMQQPHSRALAMLLLAETAHVRGADDDAVARLRELVDKASELHAPMLGVYARRALGRLIDGDEGRALIREADDKLTSEGVRAPNRWTRVWIRIGDDATS